MSTNIKSKENTITLLTSRQILLAESDDLEMTRIKSNIDLEFQGKIENVKTHEELLKSIKAEPPMLLILGRIDKLNYFKVCEECQTVCDNLPIILISKQEVVNYSFHQVVKSYGVIDVISNDFFKLNQLLQTLDLGRKSNAEYSTGSGLTGEDMLGGLQEIVTISNNYFGSLAQGNYWRKAHAKALDKFPYLSQWSADHFSKIDCDDNMLMKEIDEESIKSLCVWVQFFIEECERIIVDYQTILESLDISSASKILLTKIQ
jgi:hypothetical protein